MHYLFSRHIMLEVAIVTTTLPISYSNEEVKAFNNNALSNNLCACTQSNKITSSYKWDNQIITEEEWKISFKTSNNKLNDLINFITLNHPYDVPQITHQIVKTTKEYFDWLNNVLNPNQ
ncbi:MAG: hypothetical protein CMM29_08095 [Rhodospirillaceae bacterium]|nr:hypothetical protein [Rhodospirillaceae bacterium]